MGHPWERLPDEDEVAWAAFKAYRDQPAPRNIRRAAAATDGVTVAACVDAYGRWSWKERCAAWDAYTDKIVLEERLEYLKQTTRERTAEHLVLLKDARELVACELRKLVAWSERTPETPIMQAGQVSKMLDVTVKLERLVSGESTENSHNKTEIDFSGLSPDELRLIGPVLEKAGLLSLTGTSTPAKKN